MMRLRAFAKVNYALEVRGVRPDGYHEIRTVLQSISLADELEIRPGKGGFTLSVEPEEAAPGPAEENTVSRAWSVLCRLAGTELPVEVRLRKQIPTGAGLGGGSADAAAFLLGANRVFDLGLSMEELRGAGVKIGADVPFCVGGGTALGEGIGDDLTPVCSPPPHYLALVKPARNADTAAIYRLYDESPGESSRHADAVVASLRSGDLAGLARSIGNDLSPVTAALVPEIASHRRALLECGALGASMTGTGSAVYGIFRSEGEARRAAESLQAPFAGVFRPVSGGVEVL